MVENTSVIYDENQSLDATQKARVCSNIGAVQAVSGKQLSDENFTLLEKTRLSNMSDNAEANVIEEITVNGTALVPDEHKSVAIPVPTVNNSTVSFKVGTDSVFDTMTTNQASASEVVIPLAVATGTGEKAGAISAADKAKLDNLACYKTIAVKANASATATDIDAATVSDTITIVAGSNITLTPDTTNKAITIEASGGGGGGGSVDTISLNGGTPISPSSGNIDLPLATDTAAVSAHPGLLSSADKDKIDAAIAGVKLAGATDPIQPSTGIVTIPNANATSGSETNGLMTAADKEKLDQAVTYAENGQTGESALVAERLLVFNSDSPLYSYNFNGLGTICFITMGVGV